MAVRNVGKTSKSPSFLQCFIESIRRILIVFIFVSCVIAGF